MKRWYGFFLLLVLTAAAAYYLYFHDRKQPLSSIKVSGNIESREVNVGFKIAGRIVNIYAEEGDFVEKGKLLARLDDDDLRQRLRLAKATLSSAQARLQKLLAGSREEEIREAEAALEQARFDFENKKNHYQRMKELYSRKVISKELFDNAETSYRISEAALRRASENYNLVRSGPRKEDIDDARAQVEQAQASVELVRTQLGYTYLYSPISGIVLVKSAEVGEVINPSTTIMTLSDIENVWLRAYVPEKDLSRVKWGQEVLVKTDSLPGKTYRGKITFISSEAEFTPKHIQTEKERVTLVYRIKVDLPNRDRELKPGMPADGIIMLSP